MEINMKYFDFFENNNFVYFTLCNKITTYNDKDGQEKKKIHFPSNFSWKEINNDNYKNYVNKDDKTTIIITGKKSNLTVLDFDDENLYNDWLSKYPNLNNHLTVKTKKGYHIYFKYNEKIPNTTNINKIQKLDTRNDGGFIIAPPTKYKLLNKDTCKYKFLFGELLDIPENIINLLVTKKKDKKEKQNEEIKPTSKKDEIKIYLKHIDFDRFDNYDDWIKLGMIINNEIGEDGRDLFHELSSVSDKYNENKCDKKYDSFKSDTDNKLTIATLKMMVKEDNIEGYKEIQTFLKINRRN